MKYTFESTEAETLAYLGMAERIIGRFVCLAEAYASRPAVSLPAASAPAAPVPTLEWGDLHVGSEPIGEDLPLPANKIREEQTVAPYTPPKAAYTDNPSRDGFNAFVELVEKWRVNLGVEGAEQPERGDLMRDFANSRHSFRALGFVASQSGLMRACDAVELLFPDAPPLGSPEYQDKVRLLSTTLCQVGSIFFHELSDLYEHRDIYKERK